MEEKLIKLLREMKRARASEIAKELGYSKPIALKALTNLIKKGLVLKISKGPQTFYFLPETKDEALAGEIHSFSKKYSTKNLEEHVVLEDIRSFFLRPHHISEDVESILTYAFTEMLNNAIEHSLSDTVDVRWYIRETEIEFSIRDYGIGVFRNIMKKRNLTGELEATQELLKGKLTTMPRSHSGEGIFFTSKLADSFELKSFEYSLQIKNKLPDIFWQQNSSILTGTNVQFVIDKKSRKHLNEIFSKYTDRESGDYGFNTTEVYVKLYTLSGIHISRSQARRVLANLEKFSRIIIDFEGVQLVGQAFIDEIFRVFKDKHPGTKIQYENANEAVTFVIKRALGTTR